MGMEGPGDSGHWLCLWEAYVRSDLFLDLANYRRDGYDFDARYDDGLARFQDKQLYDLIEKKAPVLSKELRESGGYAYNGRWQKTDGKKGFDSSITRLQEQCYVIISNFVYTLDKRGNRQNTVRLRFSWAMPFQTKYIRGNRKSPMNG